MKLECRKLEYHKLCASGMPPPERRREMNVKYLRIAVSACDYWFLAIAAFV